MGFVDESYKRISRIAFIVMGFTVLLIGIAMIVLPGPAFLVIPAGLALLATEYIWARRLLKKVKTGYSAMHKKASGYFSR